MFYWYTDPVVGPGFSEVLTLMRYHHSVNTEKAKSLKLHVDGCEILRGGGGCSAKSILFTSSGAIWII
jgi:hypothetical protein